MDSPWESLTKWIWLPGYDDSRNPGSIVLFRREFELLDTSSMSINVTADSRYRLYLNGHLISFGPCKGTPLHWHYETVDATPHLRPGTNVIAAQVLRYSPAHRGNTSIMRTGTPGFMLLARSEGFLLATDERWSCIEDTSTAFLGQSEMDLFLSVNEKVQGSLRHFGWEMPGFDDHAWSKAKGLLDDNPMPDFSILPWNLFPRSIPALTYIPKRFKGVVKVIKVSGVSPQKALEEWNSLLIRGKPVTIPANSKVLLDIQAAEYTTGYLTFTFDNGAGAHVGHLSAESYELEPRDREITRKKGNRVDFQNGHLNGVWDEYVVAGRQSEVYETFWFRAFRFLRVKVITKAESLIISDISYKETNYPLDVRAKFKAQSSPMKQQFWDISLRTLKNCMHETYEDCPYYEQSQFLFDTRTQILLTYIVSGDDRLARKALLDFHSSLRPHGLIAMRYPAHTNLSLPGFSLFFPMMVHDHIMYKGDVSLAKRFFPTIDTILGYYDRQLTEQGLIGPLDRRFWSFVDWVDDWEWGVPPASKVGPVTYFSLVYAMALEYSAEVARFIGRDGLGTEYLYRKGAVISAINAHCFDGTWYYDGPIDTFSESPVDWRSQHCQIYAVLSGAIEGNEARDLINRALDDKAVHEVTLSQAFYLFRALEKTGLYEKRQDYWGSWEAMVAEGLDTWAETLVSPRSDCHAWSAVPLYELSTMILGVNPAHPGFAVADVKPLPALLKEVDSKIVTPSGMLHIRWAPADPPVDNNQESGTRRVYLKIDGPPGLQVNLYKPGDSESVVTFKGHFEGDYWLT